MNTDIKQIGIFGLSFSRDLDQTWFNLWRKEDGYSMDFFQLVEIDDEFDPIETATKISFEQGEELLTRIYEDGKVEEWKATYGDDDEGMDTEFNWTLDIDDLEENDMLFSSGNGKLPPRELIMTVIKIIQEYEPQFCACFEEFK